MRKITEQGHAHDGGPGQQTVDVEFSVRLGEQPVDAEGRRHREERQGAGLIETGREAIRSHPAKDGDQKSAAQVAGERLPEGRRRHVRFDTLDDRRQVVRAGYLRRARLERGTRVSLPRLHRSHGAWREIALRKDDRGDAVDDQEYVGPRFFHGLHRAPVNETRKVGADRANAAGVQFESGRAEDGAASVRLRLAPLPRLQGRRNTDAEQRDEEDRQRFYFAAHTAQHDRENGAADDDGGEPGNEDRSLPAIPSNPALHERQQGLPVGLDERRIHDDQ